MFLQLVQPRQSLLLFDAWILHQIKEIQAEHECRSRWMPAGRLPWMIHLIFLVFHAITSWIPKMLCKHRLVRSRDAIQIVILRELNANWR